MMLVKQVTDHDPQQSEDIALQIYSEVKEQLLNLENKIVDDQGAYKTSEVKNFNNQADEAQLSRKELELDKHEITKQVRIQLKIEGKLGADFAKSANGLSVAQGDYIKLNEAYSQKDGLFKSTNLPKDAEIKITGQTTKKGETYATGIYSKSNVELKIREVKARYGDQYVKRYMNNPEVKQVVDQKVTAQQKTFKSLSSSLAVMLLITSKTWLFSLNKCFCNTSWLHNVGILFSSPRAGEIKFKRSASLV